MFTLRKLVKMYNLFTFRGLRPPQYVVSIYKYVALMRFFRSLQRNFQILSTTSSFFMRTFLIQIYISVWFQVMFGIRAHDYSAFITFICVDFFIPQMVLYTLNIYEKINIQFCDFLKTSPIIHVFGPFSKYYRELV